MGEKKRESIRSLEYVRNTKNENENEREHGREKKRRKKKRGSKYRKKEFEWRRKTNSQRGKRIKLRC